MVSLQRFAEVSPVAAEIQRFAQEELERCLTQLAPLTQRVKDPNASRSDRIAAFRAMLELDPTDTRTMAEVYSEDVQRARRARDAGAVEHAAAMADAILPALHHALDDLHVHEASEAAGVLPGVALLEQRRPNMRAVSRKPAPAIMAAVEALLELDLGVATEIAHLCAHPSGDAAAPAGASDALARTATRLQGVRQAARHYERAAQASARSMGRGRVGQVDFNIYTLWGAALEADPTIAPHAARAVYDRAVAAGVWSRPDQRPERLLSGLMASPWHAPYQFQACVALRDAYEVIKQEAMALLHADGADRADSTVGATDMNAAMDGRAAAGTASMASSASIFRPYASQVCHTRIAQARSSAHVRASVLPPCAPPLTYCPLPPPPTF